MQQFASTLTHYSCYDSPVHVQILLLATSSPHHKGLNGLSRDCLLRGSFMSMLDHSDQTIHADADAVSFHAFDRFGALDSLDRPCKHGPECHPSPLWANP